MSEGRAALKLRIVVADDDPDTVRTLRLLLEDEGHDVKTASDGPAAFYAVRDFGAVHQRLAPGFVLDARLDGEARIVTFANGTVARELLVDCDDARRRLVYAVISERLKQHSASVQVVADRDTRARLI